jgi:hypothetical protein
MRAADFVQETTTSIAGTSGDGAITLTQITGKPRFSTALGTAKTTVRYVIEDTAGTKLEQGIGYVTSNVLTRSRPQVTWDGTTWKDGSAAAAAVALQFGSTPTSGNIIVRMAATAEVAAPVTHVRQTTLAADANWRDYRVSDHNLSGGTTAQALTAAMEYYSLYRLDCAGLLAGMQFEVTTAVAASAMKVALYSLGSDGLPGAKIVDFNTLTTATTGIKTDTTISTWTPANSVFLTPGWYAIGFLPSHAISISGRAGNGVAPTANPWGLVNQYGHGSVISHAGTYATGLAADAGTAAAAGNLLSNSSAPQTPYIGLKVTA